MEFTRLMLFLSLNSLKFSILLLEIATGCGVTTEDDFSPQEKQEKNESIF